MSRPFSSLALASSFCLLAVSSSGCTAEDAVPAHEPRSLVAFDGCTELLTYARAQLETQLEEIYRNPKASMHPGIGPVGGSNDDGSEEGGKSSPQLPKDAGPDHSKTNLQEPGVDEPDLVKTDGSRMFTLSRGVLRVVDLSGDKAKLTDRLDLRVVGKYSGRAEMLVHENKLLVIEQGELTVFAPDRNQTQIARIREIDLGVPGQAKVVRELEVEGHYVSARKVGSVVRLVMRKQAQNLNLHSPWGYMKAGSPVGGSPQGASGANMPGVGPSAPGTKAMPGPAGGANMPGNGSAGAGSSAGGQPKDSSGANMPAGVRGESQGPKGGALGSFRRMAVPAVDQARWARAVQAARAHNAQVLARMSEGDLLPRYRFRDLRVPNSQREGRVYGCEQTMRPGLDSGVQMLSVITVDLGMGLQPGNATGIMADSSTVYASSTSLYVATRPQWSLMRPSTGGKVLGPGAQGMPLGSGAAADSRHGVRTLIHKFDISNPLMATYRATGQVDGALLNQFSMSEHQGVLRVAATRHARGPLNHTDSFVATLQEQGNKLQELGRVGALGKTETIRSVRFMGDKAFVVTFRQTDPLYSIDLSNPAAPLLLGELKIEGYSAYLHPLQPGYLLGVGRDADPQGRLRGLQVSIFDVRDLHAPKRLHNYTLAGAQTQVEWDHRAFLHWPQTQSLVVPVTGWDHTAPVGQKHVTGALLLGVDPVKGISLRSRIRHLQGVPTNRHPSPIHRSVVVGERLWTLSALGMKATTLTDGAELDWVQYQ